MGSAGRQNLLCHVLLQGLEDRWFRGLTPLIKFFHTFLTGSLTKMRNVSCWCWCRHGIVQFMDYICNNCVPNNTIFQYSLFIHQILNDYLMTIVLSQMLFLVLIIFHQLSRQQNFDPLQSPCCGYQSIWLLQKYL